MRNEINVQTGCQRDRPQRTVRRQPNVIGFRHAGNFIAFGNTACVRQIGL